MKNFLKIGTPKRPIAYLIRPNICFAIVFGLAALLPSGGARAQLKADATPEDATGQIDDYERQLHVPGQRREALGKLKNYCVAIEKSLKLTGDRDAWTRVARHCRDTITTAIGAPPPTGVMPGGSGGLPVTPGPTGGGGGTGTGTGGGTGGGVKPPPAPPPVTGLNLPAPPPKPPKFPDYFCKLQDRINFTNEIGYLKNRWAGYANTLRKMSPKFGGANNPDWPAYLAAVQAADAQASDLLALQIAAGKIPIIDCTQHSSVPGGYVPPGGALGGSGVLGYAKSFVTFDGGIALVHYEFEDDFDSRHTAAVVGLRAGADWNIGGGWTLGPMGGIYTQLGRADKQGLETGINWYATAEAKIATVIPTAAEMTRALRIWGSAGFAFGEIENRTATFNQSVVAPGWTGALGVNYEFQPTWNVGVTYRRTHLGPKFVDGLRTGVSADSDQVFFSLQRNFKQQ